MINSASLKLAYEAGGGGALRRGLLPSDWAALVITQAICTRETDNFCFKIIRPPPNFLARTPMVIFVIPVRFGASERFAG